MDNRLYDHATTHELPESVTNIAIVSSEAVDPANHQNISTSKEIKQTTTLWAITQAGYHAGHPMVGDNLINLEPRLFGVSTLMIDGLRRHGYAKIKNCSHEPPKTSVRVIFV